MNTLTISVHCSVCRTAVAKCIWNTSYANSSFLPQWPVQNIALTTAYCKSNRFSYHLYLKYSSRIQLILLIFKKSDMVSKPHIFNCHCWPFHLIHRSEGGFTILQVTLSINNTIYKITKAWTQQWKAWGENFWNKRKTKYFQVNCLHFALGNSVPKGMAYENFTSPVGVNCHSINCDRQTMKGSKALPPTSNWTWRKPGQAAL